MLAIAVGLVSSPAVDAARADFAFFPDRDGVPLPMGLNADMGAYER